MLFATTIAIVAVAAVVARGAQPEPTQADVEIVQDAAGSVVVEPIDDDATPRKLPRKLVGEVKATLADVCDGNAGGKRRKRAPNPSGDSTRPSLDDVRQLLGEGDATSQCANVKRTLGQLGNALCRRTLCSQLAAAALTRNQDQVVCLTTAAVATGQDAVCGQSEVIDCEAASGGGSTGGSVGGNVDVGGDDEFMVGDGSGAMDAASFMCALPVEMSDEAATARLTAAVASAGSAVTAESAGSLLGAIGARRLSDVPLSPNACLRRSVLGVWIRRWAKRQAQAQLLGESAAKTAVSAFIANCKDTVLPGLMAKAECDADATPAAAVDEDAVVNVCANVDAARAAAEAARAGAASGERFDATAAGRDATVRSLFSNQRSFTELCGDSEASDETEQQRDVRTAAAKAAQAKVEEREAANVAAPAQVETCAAAGRLVRCLRRKAAAASAGKAPPDDADLSDFARVSVIGQRCATAANKAAVGDVDDNTDTAECRNDDISFMSCVRAQEAAKAVEVRIDAGIEAADEAAEMEAAGDAAVRMTTRAAFIKAVLPADVARDVTEENAVEAGRVVKRLVQAEAAKRCTAANTAVFERSKAARATCESSNGCDAADVRATVEKLKELANENVGRARTNLAAVRGTEDALEAAKDADGDALAANAELVDQLEQLPERIASLLASGSGAAKAAFAVKRMTRSRDDDATADDAEAELVATELGGTVRKPLRALAKRTCAAAVKVRAAKNGETDAVSLKAVKTAAIACRAAKRAVHRLERVETINSVVAENVEQFGDAACASQTDIAKKVVRNIVRMRRLRRVQQCLLNPEGKSFKFNKDAMTALVKKLDASVDATGKADLGDMGVEVSFVVESANDGAAMLDQADAEAADALIDDAEDTADGDVDEIDCSKPIREVAEAMAAADSTDSTTTSDAKSDGGRKRADGDDDEVTETMVNAGFEVESDENDGGKDGGKDEETQVGGSVTVTTDSGAATVVARVTIAAIVALLTVLA